MQLSPHQQLAVDRHCGATLVLAGAGAGKTNALTRRIWQLLEHHKVECGQILALTFTNKSAKEMFDRILTMFAIEGAGEDEWLAFSPEQQQDQIEIVRSIFGRSLWIGTFHSIFSRVLRSISYGINHYVSPENHRWDVNFTICDDSDSRKVLRQILKEYDVDKEMYSEKVVKRAISNAKSACLTPLEFQDRCETVFQRTVAAIYLRYQGELARNNSLDFDDILLIPAKLLTSNNQAKNYWSDRFRHISVDEYQDTNLAQAAILKALSHRDDWKNRSLFLVGDVDQSIYAFRGADVQIILDFEREYGKEAIIKFEENYRSQSEIINAANRLIVNNHQRYDKQLISTRSVGAPVEIHQLDDDRAEAKWIASKILELGTPLHQIAVLYRTNAQSQAIEIALIESGIRYQVVKGLKFYDRAEIKDILAYLKSAYNTQSDLDLKRIINVPKRKIGDASIKAIEAEAKRQNTSIWGIISDPIKLAQVKTKATARISEVANIVQHSIDSIATTTISDLIATIVESTNYIQYLHDTVEDPTEKIQNVWQLIEAARRFEQEADTPTLEEFLAQTSLSSESDTPTPGVSLMTLHAAKGLEYPIVFVTGLEDGFIPSRRDDDDRDPTADVAISEEERRLLYVGITRAEDRLYLTHADRRQIYGRTEQRIPSPFLAELELSYV
jgi:DNA helicase II / ATP-dependent DNA helicase PcrA